MNALQVTTSSLTVFTQRNFVAEFLRTKCDFYTENGRFAFISPLWGLGPTYDVHLRLIEKRVVDSLLLVLTELFSLGVKAEAIRATIR